MLSFLTVAGGVALILFGVRFLRKGLDRLFGRRLGELIQRMARNRGRAFFSGIAVSLMAPSSTTVSVLAVSTVQGGHLSARQALAVMLGADVGLTAMVLLISLRIDQFAPLFVLAGVLLFQFMRNETVRGIGQVVVSLGFIFLGISTIKAAIGALTPDGDLIQLITIAERHPILLVAIAAVTAILLQSSTATIALIIAMGAAGQATLPVGVAVVAGANIGIGVTLLLVGWRHLEARRLALANLLGKFVIACGFIALLPYIIEGLESLPGQLANRVAYAHTGFNVLMAMVCLPLVGPITRLISAAVPTPPPVDQPVFGPRHINTASFDSATLALGLALKEILHAGEIVRRMLDDIWRSLERNDPDLARRVAQTDDQVDLLDSEIKRYLTRVLSFEGDSEIHRADAAEQMRQLRYLNELENIGDIIDKNLSEIILKKIRLGVQFSAEGWAELVNFHHKVSENLLIAETAFLSQDKVLAQRLLENKESLRALDRQLRDRHFARLRAGLKESHETSSIHLDLLTYLKRINSHVSHVAYAILTENE